MKLTSTHWGTYHVQVADGRVASLAPFAEDRDPSPIGPSIVDLLDHPTRIRRPAVRKGWLLPVDARDQMRRACAVKDRYPGSSDECRSYRPPRFGG